MTIFDLTFENMDWIQITGLTAALFSTTSFFPQALKTIRTKDTSSISLVMYIMFTFGTLLWFVYGIISHNFPVFIANAITLVLSSIILYYKVRSLPTKP